MTSAVCHSLSAVLPTCPQAFQQCMQQLRQTGQGFLVEEQLPVHGVGHSNGALLHLLIGSQYPVTNKSNILMSFNNQ